MQQGKPIQSPEPLSAIAQRTAASVASLPEETRRFDQPILPPIKRSQALQKLTETTRHH